MTTTTTIALNTESDSQAPAAKGWYLHGCLSPSEGLTRIRIGKVPFRLGRGSRNDCCLPSLNVSKNHARIIVAVDAVIVCDLGSTNGTFVNGKRITDPTPVGEGDLLQFADMEFCLGRANAASGGHTAVAARPEEGWLLSRLHEVINQDRFQMAFQAIVAAHDLRPMGVEALVRCEVAGLESPLQLFEAAARLGLEDRLSGLCRTKAVVSLAGHSSLLGLFLNTHPHEHLGPELIASLAKVREQAGSRPLVLEIHESTVPDLRAMREFRAALGALGIGIAYDDFGKGQARLLELSEVPPDFLKFDHSLLKDEALASPSHRALLEKLIRHAADAGVSTVAEGLESAAAVDACRDLGFTHLQGYHLGRPVPADQLARR